MFVEGIIVNRCEAPAGRHVFAAAAKHAAPLELMGLLGRTLYKHVAPLGLALTSFVCSFPSTWLNSTTVHAGPLQFGEGEGETSSVAGRVTG